MKKFLITLMLLTAAGLYSRAAGAIVTPDETYMFAKRDTCELFMDIYHPAKGSQTTFNGTEKPTVIFMFGGGFIHGTRDNESYHKWFKMMTENGYRIVSIDYRLGLKGSNKVGVAQVTVLDQAIHMAVEDIFSATTFIIDNQDQLGIDPKNIVISGSSAGAITVMQAEYEICNRTSWAQVLPEGFNYAGVMSFSGAILSRKGEVKYASAPAPTLMLHGTADNLVNYKQIKFFNLGFFGGGKLVKRFEKFGYNYNMYHFVCYGHEIQLDFLQTNVIEGKRRIIEAWVDDPGVYKGVGVQSRKELYSK